MTFDLYPLRFRIALRRPAPLTPNLLRGAFGGALKKLSEPDYLRFFAPAQSAGEGPSGLADPPRPFVIRMVSSTEIGMNVFATREPAVEVFIDALAHIRALTIEAVSGKELLQLPLAAAHTSVSRVRVEFLTPTQLKGAPRPEFGVLLSRIRDRIGTLRQLYGAGPLEIDFKAFGERARLVSMTRCELVSRSVSRTSRSTGQTHALGGFTGICEYEGDLTEFLPYLEIARWTGVGRQTVWGNGELAYETF